MAFESGSMSFRMVALPRAFPKNWVEKFAEKRASSLDASDLESTSGWVTGRHLLDSNITEDSALYGGYVRLVWRTASRKVPAALLKAECRMEEIARAAAGRAGVGDRLTLFQMDALDIDTMGRRGTVVTNPPYGDRLLTREEADDLYRAMGQSFARLGKWQIYVITQSEDFQKLYGRRADKVRKLYNGMIPCYYYQFFKNPDKK